MEQFGEYDPATPCSKAFCQQVTAEEYEDQSTETTYSALQDLMKYIEENPEKLKGILAKKRREEQENGGMITFIKCKLMTSLKGENYLMDNISTGDCKEEAERLQDEMQQAFNYAQEAKNNGRRFSRRLAMKRTIKETRIGSKTKPPQAPPPPPLPPFSPPSGQAWLGHNNSVEKPLLAVIPKPRPPIHCTPPGRTSYKSIKQNKPRIDAAKSTSLSKVKYRKATPFRERTNTIISHDEDKFVTPQKMKPVAIKKLKKTQSIVSIHEEIRTFSKDKLRSVELDRSPGCTPYRTPRTKRLLSATLAHESMADFSGVSLSSLQQIIVEKFRNIRSPVDAPSPIDSLTVSSPSGFTP